jgi:RNA polymerase sigma factor (sigma-70 family)
MEGEEFLQRMRAGDHAVFDDMMPQLERIARGACRSLGVFDQRFDDVVQEVAIRVFRRWESYEGQSKLNTWLYSIARNCCLDELQRDVRYRAPAGNPDDPDDPPGLETADSSQSVFEHRLCVEQVLAELAAEPPARKGSMRKIEVLMYWVQHSPTSEELADFLQTTVAAARTRKSSILSALRELCLKYCGQDECAFAVAG